MLDQLLKQIQSGISSEIATRFNLDATQAQKSAETLADTVETEVSKQTQSGAIDLLSNLFSSSPNTSLANDLLSNLMGSASKNLISKVGLDADTASRIASEFIPKIIEMIGSKSGDGLNFLSGSGISGIMGTLGGIYKK